MSTRSRRNQQLRAQMVGADDLLDAISLVDRLRQRLAQRDMAGQREAGEALGALLRLRELMVDISRDLSEETINEEDSPQIVGGKKGAARSKATRERMAGETDALLLREPCAQCGMEKILVAEGVCLQCRSGACAED